MLLLLLSIIPPFFMVVPSLLSFQKPHYATLLLNRMSFFYRERGRKAVYEKHALQKKKVVNLNLQPILKPKQVMI